jgi:hypothetical protein
MISLEFRLHTLIYTFPLENEPQWRHSGFNVHNGVRIRRSDEEGRERRSALSLRRWGFLFEYLRARLQSAIGWASFAEGSEDLVTGFSFAPIKRTNVAIRYTIERGPEKRY